MTLVNGAQTFIGNAICRHLNDSRIPVIGISAETVAEDTEWPVLQVNIAHADDLQPISELSNSWSLFHIGNNNCIGSLLQKINPTTLVLFDFGQKHNKKEMLFDWQKIAGAETYILQTGVPLGVRDRQINYDLIEYLVRCAMTQRPALIGGATNTIINYTLMERIVAIAKKIITKPQRKDGLFYWDGEMIPLAAETIIDCVHARLSKYNMSLKIHYTTNSEFNLYNNIFLYPQNAKKINDYTCFNDSEVALAINTTIDSILLSLAAEG